MKLVFTMFAALLFMSTATAQNVGIGTTTPANKLSVVGKMDVTDSLGIGTIAPLQTLDVNGRVRIANGVIQNGTTRVTNTNDLGLYSQVPNFWMRFVTNNGRFQFFTENGNGGIGITPRMVLNETGNVGIGTSSPTNRLSVAGKMDITDSLGIGTTMPVNKLSVNGNTDIAGNLGIGTTIPLGKLHIAKTGDVELYIESIGNRRWSLQNNSTGAGVNTTFQIIDRSINQSRFGIDNNGNVGIGTTTPAASAQLDVSSTTKGLLPPRMTTAQRDLITTPAAGLVIFNTTTNGLEFRTSTAWVSLTTSSVTPAVSLQTIVIGTQQWMKENLDVAFYRNGDAIPQVTDPTEWAALTTGAWCYYNNDPTQGNKYGKLYNWYAVTDPRGLAPQGWHIPSDAEWTILETTLGGSSVAGGKMKEAGTLNWTNPNTGGNNNSGFAGLPGGSRYDYGAFKDVGCYGYWWSATERYLSLAWYRYVGCYAGVINRGSDDGRYGLSVRCLRD